MVRTVTDQGLDRWEVFATAGAQGAVSPSRIAFRCLTDPLRLLQAVSFQGTVAEASRALSEAGAEEVARLLTASRPMPGWGRQEDG